MKVSRSRPWRHTAKSAVQVLESRKLLAASLDGNGVLTVTGSELSEHIEVDINDGITTLEVNIQRLGGNGGIDIDPTEFFDATQVTRIIVNALGGDDDIVIDRELSLTTELGGGDGKDTISGGAGSDYIYGGKGEDRLLGFGGNDTLSGGASKNYLYGGDGDDRLTGSSSRDFLRGEGGNDRLYGGDGDDELDGGGNVDRLYGQNGNDLLYGANSVDRLYGGVGNDTLFGGRGNDYLFGGDGDDAGQQGDLDALDSIEDQSL